MATRVSSARWTLSLAALVSLSVATPAWAAHHEEGEAAAKDPSEFAPLYDFGKELVGAFTGGKPDVNLRLRWELADFQNLQRSNALTLRTAIGYRTKPLYGASAYAQFENVAALVEDYYNGVGANVDGEAIIADPEITQINQAYFNYAFPQLDGVPKYKANFRVGRQDIVYDDARFIGNVAWRQNYQTYDAVKFDLNFLNDALKFSYTYAWQANRIFGDRGVLGAGTRDSDMKSHWGNLSYKAADWLKLVGFIYLLEFDDLRQNPGLTNNNTATYGMRHISSFSPAEDFVLGLTGSFAYQEDYARPSTAAQQTFQTWFFFYEGFIQYKPIAKLSFAWEQLGSDGGTFQFRTPLATLHKFNGFTDTFLAGAAANGGPRGLRDYFVTLSPKLPFGLAGFVRYHYYTTDQGSARLGWEIEGVLKRKFGKHFTLLSKWAYFEEDSSTRALQPNAITDRYRFWLEGTFAF